MGAPGRRTGDGPERVPGEPRFRERLPHEHARPELNPYLALHRELPDLVIPASDAWRLRERWAEVFGRTAPLHLEVGAGNGAFLAGMAAREPAADFLGVEIRYKQVVLAARKLASAGARNGRVIRYDARFLDDLFVPAAFAAIYVNHPDPWPKRRQDKRRMIAFPFLDDVARLLAPGGVFRLKTDFAPHVHRLDRLLAEGGLPFDLIGRSDDVVRDGAPWPDDVETNYQSKMRLRGIPVLAVELRRRG